MQKEPLACIAENGFYKNIFKTHFKATGGFKTKNWIRQISSVKKMMATMVDRRRKFKKNKQTDK